MNLEYVRILMLFPMIWIKGDICVGKFSFEYMGVSGGRSGSRSCGRSGSSCGTRCVGLRWHWNLDGI